LPDVALAFQKTEQKMKKVKPENIKGLVFFTFKKNLKSVSQFLGLFI